MDNALADYLDDFTRRDWQTLAPDDVGDPVRVAVVGLGWFAREWALPGISRSAFTEATVVTDIDSGAVEAVAADRDVRGITPQAFRDGAAAASGYGAISRRRPRVAPRPPRPRLPRAGRRRAPRARSLSTAGVGR